MKTIVNALIMGMVGVVVLGGNQGILANLGLGTSTADSLLKAFLIIVWAFCMILIVIIRIGKFGKKRQ